MTKNAALPQFLYVVVQSTGAKVYVVANELIQVATAYTSATAIELSGPVDVLPSLGE